MPRTDTRFAIQALGVLGGMFLLYAIFFLGKKRDVPQIQNALISQSADPAFRARFNAAVTTPDSSLPYHRYRAVFDSIDRVSRQRALQDEVADTEDFGPHAFGVLKVNDEGEKHAHYLALGGYSPGDHDRYFRHDTQSYLAAVQWDSGGTGDNPTRYGHYAVRPVNVLYSANERQLAIPVSAFTYWVLYIAIWLFYFAAVFYLGGYVLLGYPLQFLAAISQGKPFNPRHGKMLRTLAVVVAGWVLLDVLAPQLFRVILSPAIPAEFTLGSPWKLLGQRIPVFFLAALLYFMGIAFDRGYAVEKKNQII